MDDAAALDLLRRLIACPSVTPDGGDAAAIAAAPLADAGFALARMDKNGVANLWATRGGGGAPLFVFAGHLDVVPPGGGWRSAPFAPTVRGGFLYGRGAADMKSGVAAMIAAAIRFAAAGRRPGTIALLLTGDEEGPARDGTRYVVNCLRRRGIFPDYCVVGEPTSARAVGDAIKIGRRGSLSGEITVRGKQGHVAYPHTVDNAAHRLIALLAEMKKTFATGGGAAGENNSRDKIAGKAPAAAFPPTSFQITAINAGAGADNIAPGIAAAKFNFRFAPPDAPAKLRRRCEAIFARFAASCEWRPPSASFLCDAAGPLTQAARAAVRSVTGGSPELSAGGGSSDGRFLKPLCKHLIELGPVGQTMHQADERTSVAEFPTLIKIYEEILRRTLGDCR